MLLVEQLFGSLPLELRCLFLLEPEPLSLLEFDALQADSFRLGLRQSLHPEQFSVLLSLL